MKCWWFFLLSGGLSMAGAAQDTFAANQTQWGETPALAITVASKTFTESVILGEVLRLSAVYHGATVHHQRQLGGTRIVWNALRAGEIDAYVEYTGTLQQEILRSAQRLDHQQLQQQLQPMGLRLSTPLGFNNTYALGVPRAVAEQRRLQKISDLRQHPDLRLGFSHEFLQRADGWPGLRNHYRLPQQQVTGLEHDLAYRALIGDDIQLTDVYTTDAEIAYYNLVALADDQAFFPAYQALIVYRADLEQRAPAVVAGWRQLAGRIDATAMSRMNAAVKLDGRRDTLVAAEFLSTQLGLKDIPALVDHSAGWPYVAAQIARRTREHLQLVGASLALAILFALPLGISAAKWPRWGRWVLGASGILQTVPSLALFVFLIPLLGIGAAPAIAALFVYSLLPIVRNTHTGISQISPALQDSARALGLAPAYRLWRVELPLAVPTIIAGVQTAAVINVGTATLAALIGAGGYGQPILTGIRLDSVGLIMQGAVPAAVLALLVQALFNGLERWLSPGGLRQRTA